ncbi:conjugal transfer protein TraY [Legionella busanensis]|uniref:Relaxosome protein TraY n=2 Tax=Legionella busanensis TaxID=190655 RepID=A0A378KE63_9GAMM|nr:conjugal transfer protein TraY [Legionella busanensis]
MVFYMFLKSSVNDLLHKKIAIESKLKYLIQGFVMKEKIQYKSVHITIKLSSKENKALSLAAERSGRKKIQEAKLRLEDHLSRFRSISELNQTVPYKNYQEK